MDVKVVTFEQTPAAPASVAKRQVKTLKAIKKSVQKNTDNRGEIEPNGGN